MYTQLLKEIIVDMVYDAKQARKAFVAFCRQRFSPDECLQTGWICSIAPMNCIHPCGGTQLKVSSIQI